MSNNENNYRNPSPPPNYNEIEEEEESNNVEDVLTKGGKFFESKSSQYNDKENSPSQNAVIDENDEMNDELFHMYQQIIVFMENIIKIIENDKVDDSNCDEDGDNELQKNLCYIWDITCQEENAKLVVNCIESSISIFLKLMTSTKMERTQELCLGILGNIACFESLYNSLYENEVLITIIGLTFSTSMDPEVLFSCCRLIKNLIIGFCKLTYIKKNNPKNENFTLTQVHKFHKAFIKCFQVYDIYKKFFFILENSLHSNLLKEVLDILYLLYSTVFLKEYFIFYTIDELTLKEDKDENKKIKNAQYHLNVFKNDVDYLLQFIYRNFDYLNYEKRQNNRINDNDLRKTNEQNDEKNKIYVSCKVFFEIFESKIEATLSLLRIVYTLFQNNNLLMTDEKIQKDIIEIILEWIYLQFNDMPNDFKGQEDFEQFVEEEEEEKEDPLLLDSIELSFKIISCYIQNHHNQTTLLHELFFHQNNKYDINAVLKCLITNCIPKETGWKFLNWMAQEIKQFIQELHSNIINLKNNNTKLVVQSLLLNNYDILKDEENEISIQPKIQNQDKINENIRNLIYTMAYYSHYYTKGIEQDAEEMYGDVKQRKIQKRLYRLLDQQIKTNEIKDDHIIKYIKDIIYDKEVEMDYYEKAYQLERLIVNTCCLLLSMDEIYNIVNDDQDAESRLNFEPINKLLIKLWGN